MWDLVETRAYEAAVARARKQDPWRRNWYLLCEDTVFGPSRLAELPSDLPPVLISWGGEAWLRHSDLRDLSGPAPSPASLPASDEAPSDD